MNYIDSEYYYYTFGGTLIPQENINSMVTRASSKVRNAIMDKDISDYSTIVKTTTCLVAESIYNQELKKESLNIGISSEKVGDYSVNYTNYMETLGNFDTEIETIIEENLLTTGLLYNGVADIR